jgi:REP element-mobilizing transposase RayT
MTTRWRPEFDPNHLYFITTTAVDHVHIFQRDIVKRILVDALYFVSLLNKTALYAFVVMPNHVHVIIQSAQESTLKDWTRGFKTSTAQLIIRQYEVEQNVAALAKLAAMVTRANKQKYKVWEDGYFAENVFTPEFLSQKLAYIHNNPTQPHWQLAETPEDYTWSSARFYHTGKRALIVTRDARELLV